MKKNLLPPSTQKLSKCSQISKKQIRAITLLVSRSVEGLRPEKVTIVDHMGRMLTEVQSDDPATQMTKEMLCFFQKNP